MVLYNGLIIHLLGCNTSQPTQEHRINTHAPACVPSDHAFAHSNSNDISQQIAYIHENMLHIQTLANNHPMLKQFYLTEEATSYLFNSNPTVRQPPQQKPYYRTLHLTL